MNRAWIVLAVVSCTAPSVLAGPNTGGTLFVADPSIAYSTDNASYCGMGAIPGSCEAADTELDGSEPGHPAVWKVYVAFPPTASPRLKAMAWGVHYPENLQIAAYGACIGDIENGGGEISVEGWPASDTGTAIVFQYTQTAILTEIYWFAGYRYGGAPCLFELRTHPDPILGGTMVDDAVPAVGDRIVRFGALGFDMGGTPGCPGERTGACCHPEGTCVLSYEPDCTTGDWRGSEGCDPNPCPQPSGSCCYPDGHCVETTQAACYSDDWRIGEPCDPDPCPVSPQGACCRVNGLCDLTIEANCYTGDWRVDLPCDPNPCPPAGACCFPDAHCAFTLESRCQAGDWTPGLSCSPNPCPVPSGACCYEDGQCVFTTLSLCPTGDWRSGVACGPSACDPAPPGACCLGGTCTVTTRFGCAGLWMGDGTGCDPDPCPHPTPCRPVNPARGTPLRSVHGDNYAASVGPGHGIVLPSPDVNPCPPATLCTNSATSFEDGYGWQFAGVAPPYAGAFAEACAFGSQVEVCTIELLLTTTGAPCRACDLYVWADAGGVPGAVLGMAAGINPCPVATWPSISVHQLPITPVAVSGIAWVGYWMDASATECGYYVAADTDGFGGCPFTCIAPGIGYPTGWNNVSVVWGPTQGLGIGAWSRPRPEPVKATTWGRIKHLYR